MKNLKNLPLTFQKVRNEDLSAWHLFIIHLKLDQLELTRLEIYNSLREKGIGVNVHYIPLPMLSYFKGIGLDIRDYPSSYNLYKNEISLPIYNNLSLDSVQHVCLKLIEIVNEIIK